MQKDIWNFYILAYVPMETVTPMAYAKKKRSAEEQIIDMSMGTYEQERKFTVSICYI